MLDALSSLRAWHVMAPFKFVCAIRTSSWVLGIWGLSVLAILYPTLRSAWHRVLFGGISSCWKSRHTIIPVCVRRVFWVVAAERHERLREHAWPRGVLVRECLFSGWTPATLCGLAVMGRDNILFFSFFMGRDNILFFRIAKASSSFVKTLG